MANTVNKNIIVPEVYAGLVDQSIKGKVVIAQAATRIGTLMGQVGETINFPSWVFDLEAKDIVPGQAIPTTALKQLQSLVRLMLTSLQTLTRHH